MYNPGDAVMVRVHMGEIKREYTGTVVDCQPTIDPFTNRFKHVVTIQRDPPEADVITADDYDVWSTGWCEEILDEALAVHTALASHPCDIKIWVDSGMELRFDGGNHYLIEPLPEGGPTLARMELVHQYVVLREGWLI